MRIALAQINPVVGDIDGNLERILDALGRPAARRADLVVFPELCLTGYPPRDLLERAAFVDAAGEALGRLAARAPDAAFVVGLPVRHDGPGHGLRNAAALVAGGVVRAVRAKSLLPTYDVFDEARYFDPASDVAPVDFGGERIGLTICEDIWSDPELFGRRVYTRDPVAELVAAGATLVVNVSASPFTVGKDRVRLRLARDHARRHGVPVVMVNQVGGNDELVFDGESLAVGADGRARLVAPSFEEVVVDVDPTSDPAVEVPEADETADVWRALVTGTRDYVRKCGFERALVGLSGGIDSALTLTVAVDALGADALTAVSMPSPYSSRGSVEDAAELCRRLGVRRLEIPIGDVMAAFDAALADAFAGCERDVTEENIQARIRGTLLMALSNKFGALVLSTGNKSELAVGYCTLYGDMSGGLAVISDVPKTMVYRLARWANREHERIPRAILDKPPSAELRPGQRDTDTLPPYDVLDGILERYVDRAMNRDAIVAEGFDASVVDRVLAMVRRSEYKRRQAAPGLKVTSKAFGAGRRYPVAARFDA